MGLLLLESENRNRHIISVTPGIPIRSDLTLPHTQPFPLIGAVPTIVFRECLRSRFSVQLVGMAETIYSPLLILLIIFMPRGNYGALEAQSRSRIFTANGPETANPIS